MSIGSISLKYGGIRSPLHLSAADYNNIILVQELLSQGMDPNIIYEIGTPLHALGICNDGDSHFEVAELLLKRGADVNACHEGVTPLDRLIHTGNIRMLDLFFKYKAEPSWKSNEGYTILFSAAAHNRHLEVVQMLIDRYGLDVNCRNTSTGSTPLHLTTETAYFHLKNIKCLLKNGADMNLVDHEGFTPVVRAMIKARYKYHNKNIRYSDEKVRAGIKFVIEHCDLYPNNTNEKNYFNADDRRSETNTKIFLKHLAKLQSLDIPVHPVLLKTISENEKFRDHFEQCREELLRAKSTKLENSWVSFYNLLIDSRRKLKNYTGNAVLIDYFEKSDCLNKFPIYGACMEKNVRKGFRRRELFDKSAVVLGNCMPIFDSYHLIIRDVLDCLLSKKDLFKLCMSEVRN